MTSKYSRRGNKPHALLLMSYQVWSKLFIYTLILHAIPNFQLQKCLSWLSLLISLWNRMCQDVSLFLHLHLHLLALFANKTFIFFFCFASSMRRCRCICRWRSFWGKYYSYLICDMSLSHTGITEYTLKARLSLSLCHV